MKLIPKLLSLLSNQSLLRPVRCNWFLWEEILASRLPDLLLIECLPLDGDRQSSPSFSPPRQYQRTRRRKLFWISFCNKSTWHKTSSPYHGKAHFHLQVIIRRALIFSVTRRSGSDVSEWVTEVQIDFTDVTLVSEDTYWRCNGVQEMSV